MKAKKILIGLTYYWPNVSGLSIYAKNLAEGLAERNYKVMIICAKNNPEEKDFETIGEIRIKRLGGIRMGKGVLLPFYFFKVLKIVKNTDIVICQLPSIECFWLALLAKIFGKKLITTFHCQFNAKNLLVNKIIDFIQIQICKMSENIVVNSVEYIKSISILKGMDKKMVEIYPLIKS